MLPVPVTKEGWMPPIAQEPFCNWWQASSAIRPREYSSYRRQLMRRSYCGAGTSLRQSLLRYQ